MNEKAIEAAFVQEKIAKVITCEQAFAIGEKYGIQKDALSAFCNANGIKIRACQLGCFK